MAASSVYSASCFEFPPRAGTLTAFGLAALAAFLFVTQSEVFNTASAFVSALTVGGVALVQLFDKLRPVMAKSPSESAVRGGQG